MNKFFIKVLSIFMLMSAFCVHADADVDMTSLLENPNLSNGTDGWSVTNSWGWNSSGSFTYLSTSVPYDYEVYSGGIEMSQTLSDVPNGTYALTCYVFERPSGNGSYDGSESTVASLFVNDTKTPVQHIMSDPISVDQAVDGVNCDITTDGMLDYLTDKGYVPNGMSGAAIAFGAGRYKQTVYGEVTDGTLNVGVTTNGNTVHWLIFADFHLTYLGDDANLTKIMLQNKIESVQTYLDSNRSQLKASSVTALESAITQAKTAVDSGSDSDMESALTTLTDAKNNAKFKFNPSSPEEPSLKYKITVSSEPANIAYLDGSGTYSSGTDVWINTSANNSSYQFEYWTVNGVKYTENQNFYYTQPSYDVDMVAHYKYSPENPSDPYAQFKRRLYITSEPENVATFSCSNGERLTVGDNYYIVAYGNSGYQFLGWYNGTEKISDDPYFNLTMPDNDVTLTAKYRFNPSNPADPSNFYSTSCVINAVSGDESKGTVTISGLQKERAVYGSNVTVSVSLIGDAEFQGWFDGKKIVSKDKSYTFMVTDDMAGMTLTAKFVGSVTMGDVNGDGNIDIVDVAVLVSHLNGDDCDSYIEAAADVDGNGTVDINDVDSLKDLILK